MDPVRELKKVASEVKEFDERLANEIIETSEEIFQKKEAGLIEEGKRVVCVNPVQGIFRGRIYIIGEEVQPNYFVILEEDTKNRVGIFRGDRFQIDWKAY